MDLRTKVIQPREVLAVVEVVGLMVVLFVQEVVVDIPEVEVEQQIAVV
jgi:hypothetical protein